MSPKVSRRSMLNVLRGMFWSRVDNYSKNSSGTHRGADDIRTETQLLRYVGCSFLADSEANKAMHDFKNAFLLMRIVFEAINGSDDGPDIRVKEKVTFLEAGFLCRFLFPGVNHRSEGLSRTNHKDIESFRNFVAEDQDIDKIIFFIKSFSLCTSWLLYSLPFDRSDEEWDAVLAKAESGIISESCFEGLEKKGLMFFLETCKDIKIDPQIQKRIDQISAKLVN